MNPKTFLVIASFAIFLVVRGSLDDQEQFCRKNTEYNICRKCNNTDKICERPDNGCYCDNIAIYREDEDDYIGGSDCTTIDEYGDPYCYVNSNSNCEDGELSNHAQSVQDLWYPKKDGQVEVYYSYDACLSERKSDLGNEKFIPGKSIESDPLVTETGEMVTFTFEEPDSTKVTDDEDDKPGYIRCQEQCLGRNIDEKKGVCGSWSYDQLSHTCYLQSITSCCAQKTKQKVDPAFISGYACPHCWSTHNQCPCPLAVLQTCPTCTVQVSGGTKPTHTSSASLNTYVVRDGRYFSSCRWKYIRKMGKRFGNWRCIPKRS